MSPEEKKEAKRLYDIEYRKKNADKIKKRNPEKYREQRKKRYPKHLEYLNTPEYKAYKKEYDFKFRFIQKYGKLEYERKKVCLICEDEKRIWDFQRNELCPDGRMYICKQCEANHQHEYGIKTCYVVTAIVNTAHKHGSSLTREDIYNYPYYIEAYKFNILLKREVR